ncbi:addiction module protein [Deferrisoma sp.]
MREVRAEEIEAAALQLNALERARIAQRLLDSLEQDPEISAAWAAEIEARLDRHARGEATARPAGDVLRGIQDRLAK